MKQQAKSTPALLGIRLIPTLLLGQMIGLVGVISTLGPISVWANEETLFDASAATIEKTATTNTPKATSNSTDSTSTPTPTKKSATSTSNSEDLSNAYIDPTDYSIGATQPRSKSVVNRPSVVLSKRSTGRRVILPVGQGATDRLGRFAVQARKGTRLSQSLAGSGLSKTGGFSGSGMTTVTRNLSKAALPRSVVSSIPIDIKVPKWFVPSSTRVIFPLAIPAAITSAFGWRLHPIAGTWRFHAGTDLGPPMGTPVLAAYAGKVAIANSLGGYGLAVVLEHNKGTQESLYGHLSKILVKPGAWVEQGAVIGQVGSTGNSTGPHLHFEIRQATSEGWVAVDPGQQLETALTQLVRTLQTAQTSSSSAGI